MHFMTLTHTRARARVSQKVTGLLKKLTLCKYTETKLISLCNVIPLDFNAPVPVFHKFLYLIQSEKKFFVCVFNQICTAPMTSSSDENLLPLRVYFIGPNMWKSLGTRSGLYGGCSNISSHSLTLTALLISPHRKQKFCPF
jgi:hypothetical protein